MSQRERNYQNEQQKRIELKNSKKLYAKIGIIFCYEIKKNASRKFNFTKNFEYSIFNQNFFQNIFMFSFFLTH